MFDFVVVVATDEDVEELERRPPSPEALSKSTFLPVSESSWKGAAGNGLGTLFALQNASERLGRDIIEEVRRGKSVLIVHTAGEGTRNLLTRSCRNKAFIELPSPRPFRILDGVIQQFQAFSVPSRIFVVWGDQFLFFEDSPAVLRESALKTHVLLFGLKRELTAETVQKYGIQIVRKGVSADTATAESAEEAAEDGGKLCELLDFDDSRNYDVVRRKLLRVGDEGEALVNMGIFMLSGTLAACMQEIFGDFLAKRTGKFNSDELWQLWASPDPDASNSSDASTPSASSASSVPAWLRERAYELRRRVLRIEPLKLLCSFPLSERTIWLDFGTNASYYESLMRLLAPDDEVARKFRDFLGVELVGVGGVGSGGGVSGGGVCVHGCKFSNCVVERASIQQGEAIRSVISNTNAKEVKLKNACVLNSSLRGVKAERSVIYGVVEHAFIEAKDCILTDVFHPKEGRIRLKMRIGAESGAKEKWWHSKMRENPFSLREVAEMLKGVSLEEMRLMRMRIERVADAIESSSAVAFGLKEGIPLLRMAMRGDPLGEACLNKGLREILRERLAEVVRKPLKVKHFIVEKPWGYECWCASPRNLAETAEECEFDLSLEELAFLFPEFSDGSGKFPLIVKIIKANENLSVQVHPDDAYAAKIGDAFGKEEAWFVLESKKAKIFLGFKAEESERKFREAVESGEILSHLNEYEAKKGDIFHIPAGTIHALGGGTKVYEVSSASERTFRIYDYGRGRELHIDDAINVLNFKKSSELRRESVLLRKVGRSEEHLLLEGEKFVLRKLKIHDTMEFKEPVCLLTCISGNIQVRTAARGVSLREGETAVVPANTKFEVQCEGGEGREGEKKGSEVLLAIFKNEEVHKAKIK